MEQTYEASTVQMDNHGFNELVDQLLEGKSSNEVLKPQDIRDKPQVKEVNREAPSSNKKYVFRRGDEQFEVDDDFELEMMADKRPVKMTLRELKDRAAGDVAVKNRMHSLAEEKKKIGSTFKQFAQIAKTDPLGALEFISQKAKETDSEFEYNHYIQKLADQAEALGQMDDKERKAWELEKKLKTTEQDLSRSQREAAVVLRKQEMLTQYDQIGDSQFGEMVDAVLSNESLLEGLKDEHDVMDRVEELIVETLTQRDIVSVIKDINPSHMNDTRLIFTLSDQIRQNPDLDEGDIRDIIRELIAPQERIRSPRDSERDRDIRTLSQKQRQAAPVNQYREQSASPYDLLKEQLVLKKNELHRTPLYKR